MPLTNLPNRWFNLIGLSLLALIGHSQPMVNGAKLTPPERVAVWLTNPDRSSLF